ncbi:dihydropteroate synthase [Paenibacillus sp. 481]|uniref:dihydropteroate synthase n=1 Tax=Paenibacillus sp. 481 TaxID=2835869 RepID=UPI001E4B26F9|nr:dihydropteroate synthase [Paenibacillus sp. 481]UHA75299.1 dihydropteroate synthase [Paenibacillus sp. 481]
MVLQPSFLNRTYNYRGTTLELGQQTLIMGILNVTPDSFSDGGRHNRLEEAVAHAQIMIEHGAHIIDVGGESTRPGHAPVDVEEELRRVIPVIEALHAQFPHIPISIDTYKAEVARQALEAGAYILNDVWGCKKDEQMAHVAAAYGCPIILMHNRQEWNYSNYIEDVKQDLLESVAIAHAAGVSDENIWLDPGIGFAKNYDDNLVLMHHLDELVELGYPVLLATSRKRFIRETLQLPVDDLVAGTAATVALGIAQGCQIVRVHDVQEIARLARMCDSILYKSLNK